MIVRVLVRTTIPNAPAGLYYLGDPGFPKGAAINRQWKQIGPRVGLAWDPRGDGRMSVRAYYGLAYDFGVAQNLGGSASAPPNAFSVQLSSPAGGLDNPWLGNPSGNPFPYVGTPKNAVFDRFASLMMVIRRASLSMFESACRSSSHFRNAASPRLLGFAVESFPEFGSMPIGGVPGGGSA